MKTYHSIIRGRSKGYIDLLLTQNNHNAAKSWLNLWESADLKHPEIKASTARLAGTGLLNKVLKLSQGKLPK